MRHIRDWLGTPVSGASLGLLRICFGAVMVYQTYEFLKPTSTSSVLELLYTGEHVHWNFGYPNFEWVRPLPEPYLTTALWLLGGASACLMLGIATPLAAILVGVLFTYAWMMESTWWNNHYYLSSLFCLLLAVTPSGRCLSMDRLFQLWRGRPGNLASGEVPWWSVLLFRAQLFLVYFYAAVVKMNPDWFMGEPIRMWFSKRLIAEPLAKALSPEAMDRFFTILGNEFAVYVFIVGGLVFDLSIGVLLCVRRTKLFALVLVLLFHFTNYWIFNIGAFPVMGFTATLIFLDPDWPIRVWRWLRRPTLRAPDPGWMLLGMLIVPIFGAVLGWRIDPSRPADKPTAPFPVPSYTLAFLVAYLTIQSLLPLRHLLIDGDVHWTGEGSKFSWQVMARSHVGHIRYRLQDPRWPSSDGSPYPRVEWPAIDSQEPEALYYDVDAGRLDSTDLPEILVVFEPFVGERIFFNPGGQTDVSLESAQRRVEEIWQPLYGTIPVVLPTRPIREILEGEARTGSRRTAPPGADALRKSIQTVIDAYDAIRDDGPTSPLRLERTLDFQASVGRWLRLATEHDRNVLVTLYGCRAFDLFAGSGPRWFAIVDTRLAQRGSGWNLTIMDWQKWKSEKRVYTDFTLLASDMMHFLPQMLYGYDKKGQPVALWNVERDLVPFQLSGHQPWGVMIHQYANLRIAKYWQDKFGTRPRVYVESFSKLNQHPLQPLIDPNVDLASVPLHLWRHNEWILPLKHRYVVFHENGQPRMKLVTSE